MVQTVGHRTCGTGAAAAGGRWRALPRVIVTWLPDPDLGAAALDSALTLAEVLGSRVVVAHPCRDGARDLRSVVEAAVDDACGRTGVGLPIDTRPTVDARQLTLEGAIAVERADLLVVGTAGPAAAEVAAAAAGVCGIPLLLVPPLSPALIDLADARRRVSSTVGR